MILSADNHLASIGHDHTQLTHILLNNGVYDSVGGQPSGGKDVDFCKVAIACGYTKASNAKTLDDVARVLERDTASEGPEFIEVQTIPGSRPELGRPTTSPAKALRNFIQQQKIG